MTKKAPPEVLSPSDLAYMSTLNERDRRWFLATKAADLKAQGFSYRKVSKIMGTSTHNTEDKNSSPELGLERAASAERVPAGRVCFPSIPSGRRPSYKSLSRIRPGSRRMRMWYGYP